MQMKLIFYIDFQYMYYIKNIFVYVMYVVKVNISCIKDNGEFFFKLSLVKEIYYI